MCSYFPDFPPANNTQDHKAQGSKYSILHVYQRPVLSVLCCYPNPTYLIIGYLEPLGNPTAEIIRTVKNQMKKKIQKDGDSYYPKPITLNPKPLSPKPPQENLLPQLGIVEAFIR